jgi:hypothetical protein
MGGATDFYCGGDINNSYKLHPNPNTQTKNKPIP